MDFLFSTITPLGFVAALTVTLMAGFVKGAIGFAMPMIMISGISTFLPAEQALAALIIPTVVTNVLQALRQGWVAALISVRKFWVYLSVLLVFLVFSAQLVRILPTNLLFLLLGGPVVLFATTRLVGWHLEFKPEHRLRVETGMAAFAGFTGGMSGVWGPPTVAFLTAVNTPKQEHIRVQGVIYASGAIMLLAAHIKSGVFRAETAPLSFLLVIPALLGLAVGRKVQDRLDQDLFLKITLFVLVVAGLNLIRRGVAG